MTALYQALLKYFEWHAHQPGCNLDGTGETPPSCDCGYADIVAALTAGSGPETELARQQRNDGSTLPSATVPPNQWTTETELCASAGCEHPRAKHCHEPESYCKVRYCDCSRFTAGSGASEAARTGAAKRPEMDATVPPSAAFYEHCWHATGPMITDGLARNGTLDCTCCECGLRHAIVWEKQTGPIDGHGPHVKATSLIFSEPVYGEVSDV